MGTIQRPFKLTIGLNLQLLSTLVAGGAQSHH